MWWLIEPTLAAMELKRQVGLPTADKRVKEILWTHPSCKPVSGMERAGNRRRSSPVQS